MIWSRSVCVHWRFWIFFSLHVVVSDSLGLFLFDLSLALSEVVKHQNETLVYVAISFALLILSTCS